MAILFFKPIPEHDPGTILHLLRTAYAGMLHYDPDSVRRWEPGWKEYDAEIFKYPDTVGSAGLISYAGPDMVGFASWDPRQWPTGIIGHNCVLPEFRRKGYGKQQILEIARRFRVGRFTKAIVSTSDHPFFMPARRMYASCGFREVRRFAGEEGAPIQMIEFELKL